MSCSALCFLPWWSMPCSNPVTLCSLHSMLHASCHVLPYVSCPMFHAMFQPSDPMSPTFRAPRFMSCSALCSMPNVPWHVLPRVPCHTFHPTFPAPCAAPCSMFHPPCSALRSMQCTEDVHLRSSRGVEQADSRRSLGVGRNQERKGHLLLPNCNFIQFRLLSFIQWSLLVCCAFEQVMQQDTLRLINYYNK